MGVTLSSSSPCCIRRQYNTMCDPTLYCTSGGFFGRSASHSSSVMRGLASTNCALIPRWTDAFTCDDVDTSDRSKVLNILVIWVDLFVSVTMIMIILTVQVAFFHLKMN